MTRRIVCAANIDMLCYLRGLKDAASTACGAAEANDNVNDAVNWADIDCVSAELIMDQTGAKEYRVTLSEASPDAADLRLFVRDFLARAGYPDITVVTEW